MMVSPNIFHNLHFDNIDQVIDYITIQASKINYISVDKAKEIAQIINTINWERVDNIITDLENLRDEYEQRDRSDMVAVFDDTLGVLYSFSELQEKLEQ